MNKIKSNRLRSRGNVHTTKTKCFSVQLNFSYFFKFSKIGYMYFIEYVFG